jgi:hypothetical protein
MNPRELRALLNDILASAGFSRQDSSSWVKTTDGLSWTVELGRSPYGQSYSLDIGGMPPGFTGTLRLEFPDQLLIINEHRLRRVLTEYLLHYNEARPDRSLGPLAPAQAGTRPPEPVNLAEFRIRRKQILGGLTREYYIAA